MMINKNNYEAFVLDYLEGNMDPKMQANLFSFLDQHPELDVDFDLDIEASSLPLVEFTFQDKTSLLRTEPTGELSIEEQLIALVEGDLSAVDEAKLEVQLASSDKLLQERALFTIAKLRGEAVVYPHKVLLLDEEPTEADLLWASSFEGDDNTQVISDRERSKLILSGGRASFPDKSALKKSKVVPIYALLRYSAVAAAVIIALVLFPFEIESPASAFQAYNNSGFPKVKVVSATSDQGEHVKSNPAEYKETFTAKTDSSYPEIARTEVSVPNAIESNSRVPQVAFAMADKDLVKRTRHLHTVPEVKTFQELLPVAPETVLASNSEEFTPLGVFLKGKVFNRLNIPADASTTESFSTLALRASDRIAKKTNNKLQIEAERKFGTKTEEKRKFKLRIGNLFIRRD